MSRIKPGVPTVKEIREGESEYRYIHGTGLVLYTRYNNQLYSTKMHAASTPPIMDKKLEIAIGDRIGSSIDRGGGLFIKADGSIIYTGSQSHGGNSITNVSDLDVDGHTTLDQVTINTSDGAFAVSGSNNSSITTTGSADITLTSADKLIFNITGDSDLNTALTDWDNSGTFTLTSVDDLTIETSGDNTAKTILLFNDNDNPSAFRGIHLKADSQGTSSSQNSIFIECDNRATKGGGIGVDIRSEDGVLIRGEDANNGDSSPVQIRATATVDIGGGTASITATNNQPDRTKIHGALQISNLYMSDASVPITMDNGTIANGEANQSYTKFEAIDTNKLIRATTIIVKESTVLFTDSTMDTIDENSQVTFTSTGNVNADLISNGMKVTGAGIPNGSYITNKSTNTFDLRDSSGSAVTADADGTNVTLSFFNSRRLKDDDYVLVVSPLSNLDDDAVGTIWKVTLSYDIGTTDLAQVWYCSRQNNKFAWLAHSNGEALAAADKGVLTWTASSGIRWRNETGSDLISLSCSALKIHSGTNDF